MGAVLPKPVTSIVVKRCAGALFRVGFAEMNGWRKSMEDAHIIHTRDSWGFFGVFDGHGGDQCSSFVARRFEEELEDGPPKDDAAVKEVALRLDREFLKTEQPSGSTGTFCIVRPPAHDEEGYLVRVGNIGDSRVLLGRADGTIVECQGTDFGITTDHKPDHPSEKERIVRTGGHVENVMGVARVNGDLAVSRSFGDGQYKTMGGPRQEDHPISAEPELTTLRCSATDFLLLVCDGISEGEFPNPEVVRLAARELAAGGDKPDPGAAAAAVCQRALKTGSKDNLSCMIVLLGGGPCPGPESEFLPGPLHSPDHGPYRKAYAAMARHAGLGLAEAVERRYAAARRDLSEAAPDPRPAEAEALDDVCSNDSDFGDGETLTALRKEINGFGPGPPEHLEAGSAERVRWFSEWLNGFDVKEDPDPSTMTRDELLDLLHERPDLMAMAQAQGIVGDLPPGGAARAVRVAPVEELRAAVLATPSLKWSDGYAEVCGKQGTVIQDDANDLTSQVKFSSQGIVAWLPSSSLTEVDEDAGDQSEGRVVKVAPVQELRAAVENIRSLKWFDRLAEACGQQGRVLRDDPSDSTTQVRFPKPIGFTAWLPTCALTDVAVDTDADDSSLTVPIASSAEEGAPGAQGEAENGVENAEGAAGEEGEQPGKRQRVE